MVELVISQQHFKPLHPQKQSGFLWYKSHYSLSGSRIAMCWLKLAAAAVSLCQHHCGLPIPFGGELWLSSSQTSLLDTVCACTALLFWFNTTMPPISHSASSPFTFYLYHSALPASLPLFLLSFALHTNSHLSRTCSTIDIKSDLLLSNRRVSDPWKCCQTNPLEPYPPSSPVLALTPSPLWHTHSDKPLQLIAPQFAPWNWLHSVFRMTPEWDWN